MKIAAIEAIIMYGLAFVISMGVATLIKGLYLLLHKSPPPPPPA